MPSKIQWNIVQIIYIWHRLNATQVYKDIKSYIHTHTQRLLFFKSNIKPIDYSLVSVIHTYSTPDDRN